MIDSHCHINLPEYNADLPQVLERAKQDGFTQFIIPSNELAEMPGIVDLAASDETIYFAAGVHPNNAADWKENWVDSIRNDAMLSKCVAIGEIGLDFYREYCPCEIQLQALKAQLSLASTLRLPVIIHCRNAFETIWPILSDWASTIDYLPGVLHAFDETADEALSAIAKGFMIGIGGPYTYTKKNVRRINTLEMIPLDKILLETDCPFLSPIPHRGERNEPAFARLTAQKISEIKKLPIETIDEQTTRNTFILFPKMKKQGTV